MSCLTLLAALSLNNSGTGISATASIIFSLLLIAGGELQLDAFHFGGVMHQPPFNHGAWMDFDRLVMHIPFDLGPRL
jgi:hypothetical protein